MLIDYKGIYLNGDSTPHSQQSSENVVSWSWAGGNIIRVHPSDHRTGRRKYLSQRSTFRPKTGTA